MFRFQIRTVSENREARKAIKGRWTDNCQIGLNWISCSASEMPPCPLYERPAND